MTALAGDEGHVERFLHAFRKYTNWTQERVQLAPLIGKEVREAAAERGWLVEDLADLTSQFGSDGTQGSLF